MIAFKTNTNNKGQNNKGKVKKASIGRNRAFKIPKTAADTAAFLKSISTPMAIWNIKKADSGH